MFELYFIIIAKYRRRLNVINLKKLIKNILIKNVKKHKISKKIKIHNMDIKF